MLTNIPVDKESLMALKVGDSVERIIGDSIFMELTVTALNEKEVHCGPWMFNRMNGCEIDEELGWDGVTYTGTWIRAKKVTDETKPES